MMETVGIVLLAYLIGAVPSGYLIGRMFYGVDLKKTGSGNIGATNAYRTLGAKAGLAVFFCDFMKGVIAVHLGMPEPTTVLLCALLRLSEMTGPFFLNLRVAKGWPAVWELSLISVRRRQLHRLLSGLLF